MKRADAPRVLATILALIAAAVHLTLSASDLIPGERTAGPLFALMGVGYLVGAAGIFLRKTLFYWLVAFYALGLILAYAASRDTLPIEPVGVATKVDESLLVLSLWLGSRKQAPEKA